MAAIDSEIYENDLELTNHKEERPYTFMNPKNQDSGNSVAVPQRRDDTSEMKSQSKWKKNFAIAVAVALVIIIILICVTIIIIVTKENDLKKNEVINDPNCPKVNNAITTDPGIPLAIPDILPKNCKEIKDNQPQAKSGNYWIRIQGTERILLVHCDHDTSDGGWTLVYSYEFTNYESFNAITNAVTPIPNWETVTTGARVSTLTPRNENEREAMDFSFWIEMGTEFLVKTNINNWIRCSPSGEPGGSLAGLTKGNITCEMVKVIYNCPTGDNLLPVRIAVGGSGPDLLTNYTSHYYSYFWKGRTDSSWPYHDPCGRNSFNHKTFVQNPHGEIFLR